jgi:predicted PurR-regulated permease PerM
MMGRAAKRAANGVAGLRAAGIWITGIRAGGEARSSAPPVSDHSVSESPASESPASESPASESPASEPAVSEPAAAGPDAADRRDGQLTAAANSLASEDGRAGRTDATASEPSGPSAAAPSDGVPRWLRVTAAWAWRLLLLAVVLYVLARIASVIYVVIVPCAAAILLTALLQPLAARLRRRGLGPLAATWCTLLLAFALIGGAAWLVTARVEAEYPALVVQFKHTTTIIQNWLAGRPFHLRTGNLDKMLNSLGNYLRTHQSALEGTVLTGGRIVVEILAGVVLCFFVSFFLIKDGDRIWSWLTSGLAAERKRRADVAGRAAWQAVVYYVRGTIAVAAIHAVVMGVTLTVIGAPLVAPLVLFMFLAAFIPLIGVLIAGTLAILVVLASKGLIAALVVLGIMILMNQLEGHLLQPQVVGKMVRLHPLAVILVLAVAGVVAGIAGAVVAVPITAAITSASRALHQDPAPPDTAALTPPA